jgi:hypothetical protein
MQITLSVEHEAIVAEAIERGEARDAADLVAKLLASYRRGCESEAELEALLLSRLEGPFQTYTNPEEHKEALYAAFEEQLQQKQHSHASSH